MTIENIRSEFSTQVKKGFYKKSQDPDTGNIVYSFCSNENSIFLDVTNGWLVFSTNGNHLFYNLSNIQKINVGGTGILMIYDSCNQWLTMEKN